MATEGARVAQARRDRRMTQEELGDRIGLTKGQISRIENGLSEITTARLRAIAKALGVNPRKLLDAA